MPIHPQDFRQAMGRFATGVTVVTARAGDRAHGMTVNSFTSVSLDPPLVLWCAENDSRTLKLIQESGVYGVSVLSEEQVAVSEHFAARVSDAEDRFDGVASYPGPLTGCPLLPGALATFECRLVADHDGGDHRILVARVEGIQVAEAGNPLLYFGSRYCFLAAGDIRGRVPGP